MNVFRMKIKVTCKQSKMKVFPFHATVHFHFTPLDKILYFSFNYIYFTYVVTLIHLHIVMSLKMMIQC